jgi:hypothetical protein
MFNKRCIDCLTVYDINETQCPECMQHLYYLMQKGGENSDKKEP